jgi:hypothetical protein
MSQPEDPFQNGGYTPCLFGAALIAVGVAVCLLGAQGWGWILEHGIQSGPVLALLVFVLVGVSFIVGALLRRSHD